MAELKVAENGKVTEKNIYEFLVEEYAGTNETVVVWAEKKLGQLEKRANAPRKPQFNHEANEFALRLCYAVAGNEEPMTTKEMAEVMSAELGYKVTSQKVAAALRRLTEGKVVKGDSFDAPVCGYEVQVDASGKNKTFLIVGE